MKKFGVTHDVGWPVRTPRSKSRLRQLTRTKKPMDTRTHELLAHIASLRIASREDIGGTEADALLRGGLIRQVWIGSYALTAEGQAARKETPVATERRERRRHQKDV